MKVLVTGANGFIGKEIVTELQLNNLEIFQIGGKNNRTNQNFNNSNVVNNVFYADITNYKNLLQIEKIKNVDVIIHAAGLAHQFSEIEVDKFTKVNVNGTKNILELGLKLHASHFILISSTAVYGIKKKNVETGVAFSESEIQQIDESTVCLPETAYAESKLEAERVAIEFCDKNKIALTIFRLAPVIGESNKGNVARLIEMIDKRRFFWIGDGQNFKTLIYKKDVARACVKVLLEKKNDNEIFNLAGEPIRMSELVSIISRYLGKKIPNFSIPILITKIVFKLHSKLIGAKNIYSLEKTVEKWLSDDVYSAKKIEQVYNFRPETNTRRGLEIQLEHYRSGK